MTIQKWNVFALLMLILPLMFIFCSAAVTYGSLQDAEGCYCHNSGIGVQKNGEDWSSVSSDNILRIQPGGTINLHFNTTIVEAEGVKPYLEWKSTVGDNSKFVFNPQIVYDNSPEDLSGENGTIIAMFTMTAPITLENDWYEVALIAQSAYLAMWVSVEGEPIPEFDNAVLMLTFSVFVIVAVFAVMRSRKRFSKA